VAKKPVRVLLPRGNGDRISARVVYQGPLTAPVEQGREVGRLRITRGDTQALDLPVYAGEDVAAGTIPQRALDGAWEVGTGLFRRAFDKAGVGDKAGATDKAGAKS
jgi:D-alanyl-D-alanine carboxypeptidase (penicillin-binding protein 5/6)